MYPLRMSLSFKYSFSKSTLRINDLAGKLALYLQKKTVLQSAHSCSILLLSLPAGKEIPENKTQPTIHFCKCSLFTDTLETIQ